MQEKYFVFAVAACLFFLVITMLWMSGVVSFSGAIVAELSGVSEEKSGLYRIPLASDQDSERLLYDDTFMDEAIQTHTLQSLTQSLS